MVIYLSTWNSHTGATHLLSSHIPPSVRWLRFSWPHLIHDPWVMLLWPGPTLEQHSEMLKRWWTQGSETVTWLHPSWIWIQEKRGHLYSMQGHCWVVKLNLWRRTCGCRSGQLQQCNRMLRGWIDLHYPLLNMNLHIYIHQLTHKHAYTAPIKASEQCAIKMALSKPRPLYLSL